MSQYGAPPSHSQYQQQAQMYAYPQVPQVPQQQGKRPQSYAKNDTNLDSKGLYVGNLDTKVTDALLWEIFATVGHVAEAKIIKDKVYGESAGYGFIDFRTHMDAEQALHALNGKVIYDKEIRVNWASHATKDEASAHFNIFVGDLSSEINDDALAKAFEPFGSITDARVMWDQTTGRSRGYGFVAFAEKADAERAMSEMNGVWLGSRAIRCNWANQKNSSTGTSASSPSSSSSSSSQMGRSPVAPAPVDSSPHDSSQSTNSTVYVGNLPADITEAVLTASFQIYGNIDDIRIQQGKGYAFVKFQNNEQASRAIVAANETTVGGRPIRCSWGKERMATPQQPEAAASQVYGYYPPFVPGQNYMYNMNPYFSQQYYQDPNLPPNYYQGYDYSAYSGYPQYPQHPQQDYQQQQQQQPQQPPRQ